MGAFNINITGVGGHGCERKAKPGEKLHGRCGRFTCPDCAAYDFVQRMRQSGMVRDGDSAHGIELSASDPVPEGAEVYYTDAEHRLTEGPCDGGRRFARFMQKAEFTHWPFDEKNRVVDDMLKNERKSGQF